MPSKLAKTETGIGRQAKIWNDNGHFMVQLHQTVVYDETKETITLNNGAWVTPTTVRYMNQALVHRGHAGDVAIRNGKMVLLSTRSVIPFDGNTITIETH